MRITELIIIVAACFILGVVGYAYKKEKDCDALGGVLIKSSTKYICIEAKILK